MKKNLMKRILSMTLATVMSLSLCVPAFAAPLSTDMPTFEETMTVVREQMEDQEAMYLYPILEQIIRDEYEAGAKGVSLGKSQVALDALDKNVALRSSVYETWELKSAYYNGTESGSETYFGRVGKASSTGETLSVSESIAESVGISGTLGVQKGIIQAALGFDYTRSVSVAVTKTSRVLNANEIVECYMHLIYNRYNIIQIHTIRIDGKTFTYDVPATILRPQPFAQIRFEYHY